jgi:catechol 2,3-dioxygenase-like lactoylglutathione lyase family enzyme
LKWSTYFRAAAIFCLLFASARSSLTIGYLGEFRTHPAAATAIRDSDFSRPNYSEMRLIMQTEIAEALVEDFERGLLSRRQLASRLLGLGAALSVMTRAAEARAGQGQGERPTFEATGIDHVALNVKSVPASRDFYVKHLGLKVIRESGDDNCFLGSSGDDFFLTLFKGDHPGLNHYCYAIRGYDAASAEEKLKAAGLKPRREGNRIYFPDLDGITVQVAGS